MAETQAIPFHFCTQAVSGVPSGIRRRCFLFEYSPPIAQRRRPLRPSRCPLHSVAVRVARPLGNRSTERPNGRRKGRFKMQKAHLSEAILLVNRGLDEAVQGLERLKRAKDSGLDPACFDEKVTLFEIHRASLNSYFCNNVGKNEDLDVARFERKHREYEKNTLDEIQVYRDLQVVEERRRIEGKPPKVRFFTGEEEQEWEGGYPRSV